MRKLLSRFTKAASLLLIILLLIFSSIIQVSASDSNNHFFDMIGDLLRSVPTDEDGLTSIEDSVDTMQETETDISADQSAETYGITTGGSVSTNYTNSQTGYIAIIEDDANLIGDKAALLEAMQPITEYAHVMFKSISYNSTSTMLYAYDYLHAVFGSDNCIIFLIDMDNRTLYIRSDGSIIKKITNKKSELITDNVYTYASDRNYDKCAASAFSQINSVLRGYAIAEPMHIIGIAIISLLLGMIICFIIINKVSSKTAAGWAELMRGTDTSIRVGQISTKYLRTKKEKIESSGGGGFHGGGHSSGGGGFHSSVGGFSGSGGGHRF